MGWWSGGVVSLLGFREIGRGGSLRRGGKLYASCFERVEAVEEGKLSSAAW